MVYKQKIITIVGMRPELIRLIVIIPKLDKLCNHIFVYTGQNYERSLKDVFFEELGIRSPNYSLKSDNSTLAIQLGVLFKQIEELLIKEKPEKALILGDTNSGLVALILWLLQLE